MASSVRIAIDSMGGDFGLRTTLPAALQTLALYPQLELVLVGDEARIRESLAGRDHDRLSIKHSSQVLTMGDKPSAILRQKADCSMRVAIDLLAAHTVDAVVSAGNTGALMTAGCFVLNTLPGIERPAICKAMPVKEGCGYVLDLGANVDSSASQLHRFALMATARCRVVHQVERPRVALLNIGAEAIKGNEQVKLAAELIGNDKSLNYIGFIEANALFEGGFDVLVCDGFVGNVALKACEGTAKHIAALIKAELNRNWRSKLRAMFAQPLLKGVFKQLDPNQYNGASFLGLKGVVVKGHGNSSVESFACAIEQALFEVERNMLAAIEQQLSLSLS
ncbi:phosphate acyltransferase PlsX [Dasania marina]|uniref:phosphate acyltransferase PlsX n=1 Tax=Dasania marina TaxID=471499 RepID=UPI00055B5D5A|nr:phosphate acyltransferase PlsX [Dasania marina]